MTPQNVQPPILSDVFNPVAPSGSIPAKPNHKAFAPFSIRLAPEERAYLEDCAGSRPLGTYIRDQLLGDKALKRRVQRKPAIEDGQYASLLAALGESRLSSNLNQLAHHANIGTLDVTDDVEKQLEEAYEAILAMRAALFTALGLKSGGNS